MDLLLEDVRTLEADGRAVVHIDSAPTAALAEQAADLLVPTYWNQGEARERIVAAQLGSTVWIVARDASGRVIATARALSDGARHALVLDVVTDPAWRGRGVGLRLMEALLDHPRLREVRCVRLRTRDAMRFYERLGFRIEGASDVELPWMALIRPIPASRGPSPEAP
ncbi:MAG: GNAT family N-acetyltransferase [Polyangiales bacterium]